jgi:hypothetical protein
MRFIALMQSGVGEEDYIYVNVDQIVRIDPSTSQNPTTTASLVTLTDRSPILDFRSPKRLFNEIKATATF